MGERRCFASQRSSRGELASCSPGKTFFWQQSARPRRKIWAAICWRGKRKQARSVGERACLRRARIGRSTPLADGGRRMGLLLHLILFHGVLRHCIVLLHGVVCHCIVFLHGIVRHRIVLLRGIVRHRIVLLRGIVCHCVVLLHGVLGHRILTHLVLRERNG